MVIKLSENNITSDITFVDIAKNEYYDFSDVTDSNALLNYDNKVKKISILLYTVCIIWILCASVPSPL